MIGTFKDNQHTNTLQTSKTSPTFHKGVIIMNEDKDRLGRLLRKNLIEEYKRIAEKESIEETIEEDVYKEVKRLKKENKYLKEIIEYQKTKKVD